MATIRPSSAQSGAPPSADLPSAQEELAESLLRCMGRDSAIHVCKMNGWAGVLDILLDASRSVTLETSRES